MCSALTETTVYTLDRQLGRQALNILEVACDGSGVVPLNVKDDELPLLRVIAGGAVYGVEAFWKVPQNAVLLGDGEDHAAFQ